MSRRGQERTRGETKRAAPEDLPKSSPLAGRELLRGAIWLASSRLIAQGAQVGAVILLARLLPPSQYAAVPVIALVATLVAVGDFGFQAALVQRRNDPSRDVLDVVWTYDNLVRNVVAAMVLWGLAPSIAQYFDLEIAAWMLRGLALATLLFVFENNAIAVLSRDMEYRKRAIVDAASGLCLLIAIFPLALWLRSGWAYVGAYAASVAARSVASWYALPRFPWVSWNVGIAKSLFRFGRWSALNSLLTRANAQVSLVVVGGVLGPRDMALFHVGTRLPMAFQAITQQLLSRFAFPLFSRLQDDEQRTEAAYRAALEGVLLFFVPLLVGMSVVAGPIMVGLFGDVWRPASAIVPLAAIVVAMVLIERITVSLFWGRGRPDRESGLMLARTVVSAVLVGLGARRLGLQGALLGEIAYYALQLPVLLLLLARLMERPLATVLRPLIWPGGASVAISASTVVAAMLSRAATGWVQLVIVFGVVVASTLTACNALHAWRPSPLLRQLRTAFVAVKW